MKKLYLTLFSFAVAVTAYAQQPELQQAPKSHTYVSDADNRLQPSPVEVRPGPSSAANQRGGVPFWTEDFANGLNSTNGTWTVGGTNGNIWRHSTTNTNGEWSTGTAAFNSTTNGNGFMTFDADSFNFILSPNYVPVDGELISPTIDLSTESAVSIEFEQQLRFCCGAGQILDLSVSNDGGSTWTDWDVLNALPVNQGSPNPETININISSVAANQANVRLKFTFAGGNSHYFWSVDDINLLTPAPDDLVLTASQYDDYIEYYGMPIAHIQPLQFKGWIDNIGSQPQTGVTLTADVVNSGAQTVYTSPSSSTLTIPAGGNDSLTVNQYSPTIVDDYTITYTVTQNEVDATPADNTASTDFRVTDTTYIRDLDAMTGGLWNNETGGISDSYEMGNLFEITAPDFATSVSVTVNGNTDAGVIIYAVIYEYAGGLFNYVDQTSDYTVTQQDINSEVTLPFTGTISLTGGSEYVVCIGHYGGVDAMYIGASGVSPALTTFLYDGVTATWFYMTNTPMVRLNLFNSAAPTGTTTGTNALCDNSCDGTATVTATGGMAPYSYLWSNNDTTATATNLCPGTYTVTVTGANGASNTYSFTVGAPTPITVVMSSTPPSGVGNDGTATATPSGGIPPYSWQWDDPANQTTPTANGLTVGMYICTITDANGCVYIDSVAVGNVGLNEYIQSHTLSALENPFSDELIVNIDAEGEAVQLTVYNMLGDVIDSKAIGTVNQPMPVKFDSRKWAEGVYIIKAEFDDAYERSIKAVKH